VNFLTNTRCLQITANLNSLHSRRHDISKSFFQDICDRVSKVELSQKTAMSSWRLCIRNYAVHRRMCVTWWNIFSRNHRSVIVRKFQFNGSRNCRRQAFNPSVRSDNRKSTRYSGKNQPHEPCLIEKGCG